jgi:hypothetical protein
MRMVYAPWSTKIPVPGSWIDDEYIRLDAKAFTPTTHRMNGDQMTRPKKISLKRT